MTRDELIKKASFAAHMASATPGMSDFIGETDPSCETVSPEVGLEMSTTMIRADIKAIEEAGMVIMPENPTLLMKVRGARVMPKEHQFNDFAHDVYARMLGASPFQPATKTAL